MTEVRRVAMPIALCTAVAVLEGFDIQAMGVSAPRITPEFGFTPGDMKWLFSISNIGMVLGAGLGGWLADRLGRKPVLMVSAAMFGLFTLGTVVSWDYWSFFIARLLTGLGFGAALPNMMAIASELSSPARRALTASLVFCGLPLGGGSVAFLTQVLPPDGDWRVLFIIGGILPVLLVPALYWLLPETLKPVTMQSTTERPPVMQSLFGQGRAGPTLLLWLTFFPTLLILYLMLNWLPTLAVAKGLDKAVAPQASLAFNFASIAGALLLGWLVDRIGPRWPPPRISPPSSGSAARPASCCWAPITRSTAWSRLTTRRPCGGRVLAPASPWGASVQWRGRSWRAPCSRAV